MLKRLPEESPFPGRFHRRAYFMRPMRSMRDYNDIGSCCFAAERNNSPLMDNATTLALIGAATALGKPIVDTACTLIKDLLGRSCKVAGGMLADEVYAFQWTNRIRIAHWAKQIMDQEGIASRVLPKGFLLPLLEAAGNVEDPTLQEMWARLISSGVKDDTSQHPTFIEILRQLTPDEAKIVARMSMGQNFPLVTVSRLVIDPLVPQKRSTTAWVLRNFTLLPYQAACDRPDLGPVYIENLLRLGIGISPEQNGGRLSVTQFKDPYGPLVEHPKIVEICEKIKAETGEKPAIHRGVIRVTTLGRAFMKACIAQEKKAEG